MNIPDNIALTQVDASTFSHADIEVLDFELTARQQFDKRFEELSKEGKCDSIGGMEYSRKLKAWEQLGSSDVTTIDTFVLDQY